MNVLILIGIGVVLSIGGLGVANWETWAIIVLAAINGAISE